MHSTATPLIDKLIASENVRENATKYCSGNKTGILSVSTIYKCQRFAPENLD